MYIIIRIFLALIFLQLIIFFNSKVNYNFAQQNKSNNPSPKQETKSSVNSNRTTNPKPQIKTIDKIEYTYDNKGNLLDKPSERTIKLFNVKGQTLNETIHYYFSNEDRVDENIFTYDANYNLIEELFLTDSVETGRHVYIFDGSNHKVKEKLYMGKEEMWEKNYIYNGDELIENIFIRNNEISYKNLLSYDKFGNLILIETLNLNGSAVKGLNSSKEHREYDEFNRLIKTTRYNYEEELCSFEIYNYISQGFELLKYCMQYFYHKDYLQLPKNELKLCSREVAIINKDSSKAEINVHYKFDGTVEDSSISIFSKSDKILARHTFQGTKSNSYLFYYDIKGNIIEEINVFNGKVFYRKNYTYVFDIYDNVIEQIEYENLRPKNFFELKYEYY